jgi:hypothetical protein
MIKTFRILLLTLVFTGQLFSSFADRGLGKKKNKVAINIKAPTSFASSLKFNLHNGMRYTGSFVTTNSPKISAPYISSSYNTLITYQKGNSVYILPYKQKVLVADVKQGFAGTKLIIRMK